MQTVTLFLESSSVTRYTRETSTMYQSLSDPIKIPADTKVCQLKVVQADIWNLVSNVSPTEGNKITVDPGGTGLNIKVLTIPTGQYSVAALNAAISNQLVINGLSSTLLTLEGDAPTQKAKFSTDTAGTIISFPTSDSMYKILGFNFGDSLTLTLAGVFYLAPNIAAFNNINTFLIHTDLVPGGIPVNGTYLGVVAKVPITVASGSLIAYNPPYPIAVNASDLIGARVSDITVWLTSEDGITRVDTRENYSVLLEISFA